MRPCPTSPDIAHHDEVDLARRDAEPPVPTGARPLRRGPVVSTARSPRVWIAPCVDAHAGPRPHRFTASFPSWARRAQASVFDTASPAPTLCIPVAAEPSGMAVLILMTSLLALTPETPPRVRSILIMPVVTGPS